MRDRSKVVAGPRSPRRTGRRIRRRVDDLAEPSRVALPEEAEAYHWQVREQTEPLIGVLRAAALTDAAALLVRPGHLPDDAGMAALTRWPEP